MNLIWSSFAQTKTAEEERLNVRVNVDSRLLVSSDMNFQGRVFGRKLFWYFDGAFQYVWLILLEYYDDVACF